jgi:hypothetical protein
MSTIKVPNISFLEYANLDTRKDYDYYLRYANLKGLDLFCLGDFLAQPFGFVKDMQEYMNYQGLNWEDFFTEMSKKTGEATDSIVKRSLFDLQRARIYIRDEIEKINTLERTQLGHTSDSDEERAGIDVFNKFRSFIQFDKLAQGDIRRFKEIEEIPYDICFTKLLLDAEKYEFDKRLNKVRSSKK